MALIYWALSAGVKSKTYLSLVSLCLAPLRPLPFPDLFVSVDWSRRRSTEAKRSEPVKRILSPAGILFSTRAGAQKGRLVKVLRKNCPENRSSVSKVNSVAVDGKQLLPTVWKKRQS